MRIFILGNPDETAYSSVPENDHGESGWGARDQTAFAWMM
jgi:hypothetical protein